LDESGAKLSYQRDGNEITFTTQAEAFYWVTTSKLLKASPERVRFSGEPNQAPKVYARVRIGKQRDF
jgi:hypothetical protein